MEFDFFEKLDDTKEELTSWEHGDELSEADYEKIGSFSPPEIRYDVEGVEAAIVSGDPYGAATYLDSVQGDEVEGALGTCGLTSVSNICKLDGLNVSEGDVVTYALENGLCRYDPWSPADTGGTTEEQVVEILEHYGIDAHWHDAADCSDEQIAQMIEGGHGVMVGLDAGTLWGEAQYTDTVYGQVVANHFITVTGVARDADTGEVAGYYICDSGRGLESDSCRYISVDMFHEACTDAYTGSVVVTDDPIRIK